MAGKTTAWEKAMRQYEEAGAEVRGTNVGGPFLKFKTEGEYAEVRLVQMFTTQFGAAVAAEWLGGTVKAINADKETISPQPGELVSIGLNTAQLNEQKIGPKDMGRKALIAFTGTATTKANRTVKTFTVVVEKGPPAEDRETLADKPAALEDDGDDDLPF